MKFALRILSLALVILLLSGSGFAATKTTSIAENETEAGQGASGLKLPRFAALRSGEVNLRTGPGTRYPIEWVFRRKGLPVEIIAEYEIWRRVRDPDGAVGWVHRSAISGKRSAITTKAHELRSSRDDTAASLAHLEAGVIGQLLSCNKEWCKLKFDDIKGYMRKGDFWGAYPDESFD